MRARCGRRASKHLRTYARTNIWARDQGRGEVSSNILSFLIKVRPARCLPSSTRDAGSPWPSLHCGSWIQDRADQWQRVAVLERLTPCAADFLRGSAREAKA